MNNERTHIWIHLVQQLKLGLYTIWQTFILYMSYLYHTFPPWTTPIFFMDRRYLECLRKNSGEQLGNQMYSLERKTRTFVAVVTMVIPLRTHQWIHVLLIKLINLVCLIEMRMSRMSVCRLCQDPTITQRDSRRGFDTLLIEGSRQQAPHYKRPVTVREIFFWERTDEISSGNKTLKWPSSYVTLTFS